MVDFAAVPPVPAQAEYLEGVAAAPLGRAYKQWLLDALDVRPGRSVLDVGRDPAPILAGWRIWSVTKTQHIAEPARALSELRRVLRPDGVLGMAEPDWDTLTVDDSDVEASRAFVGFVAGNVRSGAIGRQLARLVVEAQFALAIVDASVAVFRDFDAAEQVLGIRRNVGRTVQAGALDEAAARGWLDRLTSGPFPACFTYFIVTARA
jgi:SAM-dependent methyltransferase